MCLAKSRKGLSAWPNVSSMVYSRGALLAVSWFTLSSPRKNTWWPAEVADGGTCWQPKASDNSARLARPHLHLVITDIVMPNLDGRQLGRYLRMECPEVPIIYISAFPPGDLFGRDAPAGARFLQKPFSPEELQGAVRSCLSDRRSERSGGVLSRVRPAARAQDGPRSQATT